MLKDILTELAATSGIKLDTKAQRDLLIFKINKEAKELYENLDLHNSLREQIFEMGIEDQMVTLPWYVSEVRAMREYDTQLPFIMVDMKPKYQTGEWDNKNNLKFRIKQKQYPLEHDLSNQSRLTFTFTQPLNVDLLIYVTGRTTTAARTTESLIFPAGSQTGVSVNSWVDIESFQKSAPCNADCNIFDVDGNKISEIPNCELRSSYTLIQGLEPMGTLGQTRMMLILYKTKFTPFIEDTDVFPCGDIYDRAIYWKTLANIYTTVDGKDDLVNTCISKVNEILVNVATIHNSNLHMQIDFGRNRFHRFWVKSLRNRFTLIRDNPRGVALN